MIALAEMQEMGSINLKLPTQGKEGRQREKKKPPFCCDQPMTALVDKRLLARGEAISCNHTESNLLDLEEGWSGELGGTQLIPRPTCAATLHQHGYLQRYAGRTP